MSSCGNSTVNTTGEPPCKHNPKCMCTKCECGEGCSCNINMTNVCDPCKSFKKVYICICIVQAVIEIEPF